MSTRYKILMIALLAVVPLWVFAKEKTSSRHQGEDLAAQIQSQVATAAPNAVVIVVDQATKTAYVTGSQSDVDQITQALRMVDGIRVIGSPSNDSRSNTNSDSNSGMDTSSRTSGTERNYPSTQHGSGTGSATPVGGSMNSGDTSQRANGDMDLRSGSNPADMSRGDSNNPDVDSTSTRVGAGGSAAGTKTGSATNGTAISDASLTQSVKDAFSSEGMIGQNKIVVDTRNGVVTLTGIALSEAQADRMVELARQVPGVNGVNANIQLQDEKRPYKVKPSPEVDKRGGEVDTDEQNPHL